VAKKKPVETTFIVADIYTLRLGYIEIPDGSLPDDIHLFADIGNEVDWPVSEIVRIRHRAYRFLEKLGIKPSGEPRLILGYDNSNSLYWIWELKQETISQEIVDQVDRDDKEMMLNRTVGLKLKESSSP
jgi:hypothetical protein